MNLRNVISITLGGSLLLLPCITRAQDSPGAEDANGAERGYAYIFEDDPLGAVPNDARGARIKVRPIGKRTLLIRPRVHFVAELFKSAENF